MAEQHIEADSGRLVHQVIAHSYLLYLTAVVLGLAIDIKRPFPFAFPFIQETGMTLIVLGTIVIYWAQNSARKGAKLRNNVNEKICRDHFCMGPYVFTRIPTQYGLSFMALGLGFLWGSFSMVVLTVISFLIGRFVFVPKQERHLEAKYGEAYLEYKRHVKR
jgi:protein-S-isoprenylcysteine O-methyltransferase Ste14